MAKQVAKRVEATVVTARMKQALATQFPELPETLDGKIDPYAWLKAMVLNAEYTEPDPDYIAREMLMNVLLTEDDTEALVGAGMDGLQDVLEDFAGNTTGPIRILDLYVARSDADKGDGTYLIITWWSHEDGKEHRATTGASTIQWAFLRYLAQGIWPIECQIVRDKATDQGGKHLMKIWPVDAQ
jgi:hypothetical protein